MSDEDRAKRLQSRRKQARSKASETDEPSELDETSDTSETDESDSESVKDEREGTYMYLPEDQKQEINLAFKRANLAYEEETGEELEKNRHFYPLLVQEGLDGLDGLDGRDIKERLEELGV